MDEDEDDAYLSNQRQQTKKEESRRRYINERDTIVDLMDRYNTSKNITIRKERVEKREDVCLLRCDLNELGHWNQLRR